MIITVGWSLHTVNINVSVFLHLPPWRWPHEWSEHVAGRCVIKLRSYYTSTFVGLCNKLYKCCTCLLPHPANQLIRYRFRLVFALANILGRILLWGSVFCTMTVLGHVLMLAQSNLSEWAWVVSGCVKVEYSLWCNCAHRLLVFERRALRKFMDQHKTVIEHGG
jgi:hypothetical protein